MYFVQTMRKCYKLPDHFSKQITQVLGGRQLQAISDCLPILALLEIILTSNLHISMYNKWTNSDVYALFIKKFHVIRRSNQFWAGLSSDLVIEHIFMRSEKSSGELNHRSYMNEELNALWTSACPHPSHFHTTMLCRNSLLYLHNQSSARRKTLSKLKRDYCGLEKIKKNCNL